MAVGVKGSDWQEIERLLDQKEAELLEKQGVHIPSGHLHGYKYTPQARVVDKQPWDVVPAPNYVPRCTSSNWSHADVSFEVGEGIAYITLNRPQANNALNDAVMQGLHDACFELHRRQDIRIAVLRAEGKMFCAGGDPRTFQEAAAQSDAHSRKSASSFMKLLYFFQCLPQFTVGLAQGSAMGTGLGLLAACDVVCAVATARFIASEVKLGACPATIAPVLVSKIGPAYAKRILCTAENVSAQLALSMGLLSDIVDDELDFTAYLSAICDKITLCAPLASARSKRLVQNVSAQPLTMKLLSYTGGELADVRVSDEAVKGMVAVQARTRPFWAEQPIKPLY